MAMDVAAIAAVAATASGTDLCRVSDTGTRVRVTIGDKTFGIVYSGLVTRDQAAVEALTATLCASTDCQRSTSGINALIARAVADSTLTHAAHPHGMWSGSIHYPGATVSRATPPSGMAAVQPWGVLYVDDSADTTAPNTRVELGPMYMHLLTTSGWVKSSWRTTTGHWYFEDFHDDTYLDNVDIRTESNGNLSVTAGNGRTYHFFPSAKTAIVQADTLGVVVTQWARLVVNSTSVADDRASAKYLLAAGCDWWLSTSAPFVADYSNNPEAGWGRFSYVTNDWQAFRLSTIDEATLRANPLYEVTPP